MTVTFRPFGVFADRIICYGFGFGKDLTGLLIGILQDLFFGLFDLFGLLTQLLLETGYFLSAFRDCFLLLLELDAGSLQITQHIFKVLGVGGDALSGVLYDILTQTELAGYGKSITLAGDADQKTVGRLKGCNVKFTAGVLYIRCLQCIKL